jgi:signal peptidase
MNVRRTFPIAAIPSKLGWPRVPHWLRVSAVAASYVVAFIAVGVLLAATLPGFAGFHTVTVYGGSMGKALPAGSVAITRPVDATQLAVGDVIAMGGHERGLPILHRIVAIEDVDGGRLVTTRGDANETNDRLPITVSGKGDRLVYHIPWIGYFLAFSRSALGLALLVGIPASIWVVRELLNVRKAIKRRIERKAQRNGSAKDVASRDEPEAIFTDRPEKHASTQEVGASMIDPSVESTPSISYAFIPIDPPSNVRSASVPPPALDHGRVPIIFVGLATVSAGQRST